MSYDINMVRGETGTGNPEGLSTSPPTDTSAEARKQQLADALISLNPELERFHFNYENLARSQRISIEEAKLKFRHIELNGPKNGNGIQITIFDDEVSVAVPYWHQDVAARTVFAEVWRYLDVLQRMGGYRAYDPQLGRFLNLSNDFETVISGYGATSRETQRLHQGSSKTNRRRHWWKFW